MRRRRREPALLVLQRGKERHGAHVERVRGRVRLLELVQERLALRRHAPPPLEVDIVVPSLDAPDEELARPLAEVDPAREPALLKVRLGVACPAKEDLPPARVEDEDLIELLVQGVGAVRGRGDD